MFKPLIIVFSILAFCSMVFCIWARYRTSQTLFHVFKPLTAILIITVAAAVPGFDYCRAGVLFGWGCAADAGGKAFYHGIG